MLARGGSLVDAKHAVLATVAEQGDTGLVGRTLLQKKIYFAALLSNEDFAFKPHYYGPYSPLVADATDALVSNNFLEERIEVFPGANVFGEIRRHTYKVTPDGNQLLESIQDFPGLGRFRECLRRANSHPFAQDFNLLSIAAKVMMVKSTRRQTSVSEIKREAKRHGWSLSDTDIENVRGFLSSLGLAR
jgi:hypothetical protein